MTHDCHGQRLLPSLVTYKALSYSLPNELIGYVNGLLNVIDMPFSLLYSKCQMTRAMESELSTTLNEDVVSVEDTTIPFPNVPTTTFPLYLTPQSLFEYYNIFTNNGMNLTTQSVFEALGNTMSTSDLTLFQQYYNLPIQGITNDIGGHVESNPCTPGNPIECMEANLDVQYIMAIAQNVPTTYWYDTNQTMLFLNWILALEDNSHPPIVNSISIGEYEFVVPQTELDSFNIEAMKLGLRGVTLVTASGDWGVTGPINNISYCGYNAFFPATNPYVLTVGASQGKDEVVCQGNLGGVITSGGGFSSYYSAPSYQTSNIKNYFIQTTPYQNVKAPYMFPFQSFNQSKRGYPDVSAFGAYYSVMIGGVMYVRITGTSVATPVIAGMLSLINAGRKHNGQPYLGFVNPLLYQLSENVFNDIMNGNNSCLEASSTTVASECCVLQGFQAVNGWDPITGLGSINFKKFYNAVVFNQSSNDDNNSIMHNVMFGIALVIVIIMILLGCCFVFEIPARFWSINKTTSKSSNDCNEIGMTNVSPNY